MSDAWPPGEGPRLLVADSWAANAGDAAISLATVRALRDALPGARILVCVSQLGLVRESYPELPFVASLAELVRDRSRLVPEADAVISQGGGFLFEHYNAQRRLEAHREVIRCGKPLAFWGHSIGRFEGSAGRTLLREVLESAAIVVTRDPETIENLRVMGIEPACLRLGADPALLLECRPRNGSAGRIGLTLSSTAVVPANGVAIERPADLVRCHAELAARLTRMAPVSALSTVQGLGRVTNEVEDDSLHALAIRDALSWRRARRFEIVSGFMSVSRFARALCGLGVLVTSRMHAAMLAMLHGVPAVYVSGNFKGISFFRRLGCDLVAPDTDPGAVVEAVARAELLAPKLPAMLEPLRAEASASLPRVLGALGLTR